MISIAKSAFEGFINLVISVHTVLQLGAYYMGAFASCKNSGLHFVPFVDLKLS